MLLNLRFSADSIPSALTNFFSETSRDDQIDGQINGNRCLWSGGLRGCARAETRPSAAISFRVQRKQRWR
jgi:hypothetical protein